MQPLPALHYHIPALSHPPPRDAPHCWMWAVFWTPAAVGCSGSSTHRVLGEVCSKDQDLPLACCPWLWSLTCSLRITGGLAKPHHCASGCGEHCCGGQAEGRASPMVEGCSMDWWWVIPPLPCARGLLCSLHTCLCHPVYLCCIKAIQVLPDILVRLLRLDLLDSN